MLHVHAQNICFCTHSRSCAIPAVIICSGEVDGGKSLQAAVSMPQWSFTLSPSCLSLASCSRPLGVHCHTESSSQTFLAISSMILIFPFFLPFFLRLLHLVPSYLPKSFPVSVYSHIHNQNFFLPICTFIFSSPPSFFIYSIYYWHQLIIFTHICFLSLLVCFRFHSSPNCSYSVFYFFPPTDSFIFTPPTFLYCLVSPLFPILSLFW